MWGAGRCPGTRMVAFAAAGLTPQSLTRQLPFQGRQSGLLRSYLLLQLRFARDTRLCRNLALPFMKRRVVVSVERASSEYRLAALGGRACAWGTGVVPAHAMLLSSQRG